MFTKGYTLTEVLIALALTSILFTGAWSAQWFARQQLLLATEQLHAIALLRELRQLIYVSPLVQQHAANCADSCQLPSPLFEHYSTRISFFQQAGLTDIRICVNSRGLIVSWQSAVKAAFISDDCGGAHRQRITLTW